MHLQIATRHVADAVIAAPVGRIDHRSAAEFEAALTPLVAAAAAAKGALVLDFSAVEYISSVGLRVLMMAAKQLRGQQRKLGVAAAKPLVGEIFEISRFNLILDLSPTVRAGLERMSPAAVAAYDASAASAA